MQLGNLGYFSTETHLIAIDFYQIMIKEKEEIIKNSNCYFYRL
jgi:hypothetical protein